MADSLAVLLDWDASDRVLTLADLSELEPPSKKRKTGEFSSENEGGVVYMSSDGAGFMSGGVLVPVFVEDFGCPLSSEIGGGVDDSRSSDDGWTSDDSLESEKLALSPMELEPPFSGKSSSENEGRLDDRRSNDGGLSSDNFELMWSELCEITDLGDWPYSKNKGGVNDSRSNGDGWMPDDPHELGQRALVPMELEPPFSGKESNEINGVGGSCEVHPVAGKCPVRHPKAVQLLLASSSNSDCLDVNLRMKLPLQLWLRDMFSQPIHHDPVGTIFGNLKPEKILMTNDRLVCGQLSYIKKNNMDPFLVKSTPEAKDLFSRLLEKNPELSRLEAREVLAHPFSWSLKVKLHFLQQMREMLASENMELHEDLLEELESNEPPVFDGNWIDKLDPVFKDYILERPENYDYSSVVELVRCIRNISIHLLRLPRKIKKKVGWNDEDFYNYFAVRFPSLFMKLYRAASRFCKEERWFKEFHEEIFREFRRDAL